MDPVSPLVNVDTACSAGAPDLEASVDQEIAQIDAHDTRELKQREWDRLLMMYVSLFVLLFGLALFVASPFISFTLTPAACLLIILPLPYFFYSLKPQRWYATFQPLNPKIQVIHLAYCTSPTSQCLSRKAIERFELQRQVERQIEELSQFVKKISMKLNCDENANQRVCKYVIQKKGIQCSDQAALTHITHQRSWKEVKKCQKQAAYEAARKTHIPRQIQHLKQVLSSCDDPSQFIAQIREAECNIIQHLSSSEHIESIKNHFITTLLAACPNIKSALTAHKEKCIQKINQSRNLRSIQEDFVQRDIFNTMADLRGLGAEQAIQEEANFSDADNKTVERWLRHITHRNEETIHRLRQQIAKDAEEYRKQVRDLFLRVRAAVRDPKQALVLKIADRENEAQRAFEDLTGLITIEKQLSGHTPQVPSVERQLIEQRLIKELRIVKAIKIDTEKGILLLGENHILSVFDICISDSVTGRTFPSIAQLLINNLLDEVGIKSALAILRLDGSVSAPQQGEEVTISKEDLTRLTYTPSLSIPPQFNQELLERVRKIRNADTNPREGRPGWVSF